MIKRFTLCFFFLTVLIQTGLVTVSAQDNQRVARTISAGDLNELCPGKFVEIHAMANNDIEAGMAVVKLFFLVDPDFLRRAANSGVDPTSWGIELGETFRFYCERRPVVSVRTAVNQTIAYLQ